jgi:hypothetical protein
MLAKFWAILAILGLTGTAVQAAPTAAHVGNGAVEARAQPWREFKREAVANETPDMTLLALRGDEVELAAGSSAG